MIIAQAFQSPSQPIVPLQLWPDDVATIFQVHVSAKTTPFPAESFPETDKLDLQSAHGVWESLAVNVGHGPSMLLTYPEYKRSKGLYAKRIAHTRRLLHEMS